MNNYDDIINFPHHESKVHPKMSLYNRSAQFAPFAALTGYDDAIIETARLTDKRINIDDGLKELINNNLQKIESMVNEHPLIEVTYFVKDKKKDGGSYITINGNIKRIDTDNNLIILTNKTKVPISEIINVKLCNIDGN